MSVEKQPNAVAYARRVESRAHVRLSEIEENIANEAFDGRSPTRRAHNLRIVAAILSIFTFGAFATIGPQGAIPGIMGSTGLSSAPMDDDVRDILMPLSFAMGIVGLTLFFLAWVRGGRSRDHMAIVGSVIALLTSAGILNWYFSGEGEGVLSFVLACLTIVLALVVLVSHALLSQGPPVEIARHHQVANMLRELPEDEQSRALDVRAQALQVLRDRGFIDQTTQARALDLPLGDLWTMRRTRRGKIRA
ncbi:hypothetical protein [Microbacterium excoecariae]|uniref:hypothetical protein n=1 Tax=Microbacterium excoecariae TaxID=2715210 RepID=UPI001409FF88|nr:hypothetical protein [Microbacterium excoecariae]NHI16030.1 hypothetical protein [Microbacterium excoecariae]